jgi:hypothetical protein
LITILHVLLLLLSRPPMAGGGSLGQAGLELAVMLVAVWFVGIPTCTWLVSGRAPFHHDFAAGSSLAAFAAETVAFAVCAAASLLLTARAADQQTRLAEMAGETRSARGRGREAQACVIPAAFLTQERDLRAAEVLPHDAPLAARQEWYSLRSQERPETRQRFKGRERGHHAHEGKTPAEHADHVEEQERRRPLILRSASDVMPAGFDDSQSDFTRAGSCPETLHNAYESDIDQECSPLERQDSDVAPLTLFREWEKQKKQKMRQDHDRLHRWRLRNRFLEIETREQEMVGQTAFT